MKKKESINPVEEVAAFLERNSSVLMRAHDIAIRTNLSIGAVNRALITLHQQGEIHTDSEANLWTNFGLKPREQLAATAA